MKRIIRNIAVLAAAIAAAACAKEMAEVPSSNGNLQDGEGITFTASLYSRDTPSEQSTKVAIDIDETAGKAKLSFTAGDVVAVSDGTKDPVRITLTAENINHDGTATFKANVSADAETYFAYVSDKNTLGYYELDKKLVYTNVKNAGNPNEFKEIDAGRAPHAAFASCGKDGNLSFRNMLTLMKFNVSTPEVSYVEFQGNKGEYVIGRIQGNYDTGEVSLSTYKPEENSSKTAKSYVKAAGADCYLALAPGVSYAEGFSLTAYDASGNVVFVTKRDKAFSTTAGKIWDLGTLEEHKMTPYELWEAGYDIEIGGKMYNKASYGGTVKHVTKSMGETAIGPGVWFVDSDASVKNGGYHKGSVIVVGNTEGQRSQITLSGGSYVRYEESMEHHVIAFKNMKITPSSNNEILPGTEDFIKDGFPNEKGTIIIDNCFLTLNRNLARVDYVDNNSRNRGVFAGITVVNSEICVTQDEVALLNTWNSRPDSSLPGMSLTAKNNVIWSADGHKTFYFAAGYNSGAGVWPFKTVVIENNTLYNVYTGVNNNSARNYRFNLGLVMADKVSEELTVRNNMFYTSESLPNTDQNVRYFTALGIKSMTWAAVKAMISASGNWCDYNQMAFCRCQAGTGDSSEDYWRYSTTFVDNTGETKINPFESFDLTTGEFKMAAGYEKYGARR